MSDNYPVERSEVSRQGVRGVLYTGGGLGLMLFNSLLGIPVLGHILGGALVILGILGLFGRKKNDKLTGTILLAAGGLGLASFLFKGLTSTLLGIGGVGLLIVGVISLFKFVKGIKSRS